MGIPLHKGETAISYSAAMGGVQLRINSSDAELARDLIGKNGGDYDFLQNIKNIQNFQIIIDAGANIGLFSMIARREAPNARIIAVEPDHGNCAVCRVNMGFRAGDTLIEAGLWNKNCRLGIKSRATGDVGFTVYEDEKGAINTVCMKQMILDNRLTSIDICKIDIEGSEYEVFDYTAEEWVDIVRIFIVELHDRIKSGCSDRVNGIMNRHGFMHKRIGENEVYYKAGEL